jgi:hypothetical protein
MSSFVSSHKYMGKPKMALTSSSSLTSDATPMRGNTSSSNEWIQAQASQKPSAQRILHGRMPLGRHPPPDLSVNPPKPSEAKVKYFHNYSEGALEINNAGGLKKEKSNGTEDTEVENKQKKAKDIKTLPLEKQLEYYKKKLLFLAKEHAALLATAHQKKRFGKVEIRVKPDHMKQESLGATQDQSQKNKATTRDQESSLDAAIVQEQAGEEESTQVESTEDQLLSYSQLSAHTTDDGGINPFVRSKEGGTSHTHTKCGSKTPLASNMARSLLPLDNVAREGKENISLATAPFSKSGEVDEDEEATVLGDDASFPPLSQESIHNIISVSMPLQEYNAYRDFMQDLPEILGEGDEEDPANTIMSQLMRCNSLLTRQSSMGQESSIIRELDDGQESLATFDAEIEAVASISGAANSGNIKISSHTGFSQLSQLHVESNEGGFPDEEEEPETSQLTVYDGDKGGSQRFEPNFHSQNEHAPSELAEIPQQLQFTETSLASSGGTFASHRDAKLQSGHIDDTGGINNCAVEDSQLTQSSSLTLQTFDQDKERQRLKDNTHLCDAEEAQPEDSQMTQLSIASSVFHTFGSEEELRQSEMHQEAERLRQTKTLPSVAFAAKTAEELLKSMPDKIKTHVRVGVGVLVKDPCHPNKVSIRNPLVNSQHDALNSFCSLILICHYAGFRWNPKK